MAYHATYRRTADRSDRAAACEHRTANGTNARTDRGALILRRHSAASRDGERQCHCDPTYRNSMCKLHAVPHCYLQILKWRIFPKIG